MPRICQFLGIIITMYYRDHNPPHFHAIYSGSDAEIQISPAQIIDGQLPPRIARLVIEWAEQNQVGLMRNWALARAKQPLELLPPLE